MKRRDFLVFSTKVGAGITLSHSYYDTFSLRRKKNVLILGGTQFIGPAIVTSAIHRGINVTLLNRGITNPDLFPKLPKLRIDRTQPFPADLANQKWDAIIDTWPEDPRLVESSARFFRDLTEHYVFVSSIAVYADYEKLHIPEDYPTKKGDQFRAGHYGTNKAICERIVQRLFPDNCTIIRPGSIIGSRDPSYGFRFWTWRVKRGSEIIAPGNGKDIIQFIDVSDVANWIVTCCDKNITGTFNCVGPERDTTFSEFLQECKSTLRQDVNVRWLSEGFLKSNHLDNRKSMPLWNSMSGAAPGFECISNQKVITSGMKFTDTKQLIRNSVKDYSDAFPFGVNDQYGLTPEKEAAILEKCKTGDS